MTTPGALIAGRYRLRNRVASGGMGSVWEAQDEVLGRRVAVKLLLPQPGISPTDAETARNRVIREARITARLHHPHAVTLYDVVEHAGQPALIMQYVPSRSLNAILQERGVLPEQVAARIGAELASALTAAHLAGIVHRDIKPSNVLITDDGSAKLTDFGISHAAGDVNLTSTGMVSGTPAYLAPEVARGAPSGFPADVFSLGATLYATLEGAPPFGTDVNPMAILHRVASGQVILPRRSGSLTPLLLHMLAPMPGNRPTMAEVARALTAAVDGFRTPAELERPTTVVPPPTVRDWPADPPAPVSSLSDSLLGAGHLPDPPGSPAPVRRAAGATPAAAGSRRRPLVLGAVAAVVVVGLIALGIALLTHRGGSSDVAGTTGSSVAGASSSSTSAPPRTSAAAGTPAAAVVPPASTAAATRSAAASAAGALPQQSRSSTSPSVAATSATTSTTAPSSTTRTTTSSSTTSSSTTRSSTSSTTSSSQSPEAATGTPTAGQLAAAVTDYYAELPTGTDDGWAHLAPHFQSTIAKNRESYQAFWDGIESVSVSNVQGTAPGTVTATVTYRLKNGNRSVEPTTYRLVRADGTLKIDSQD